jgi:hypothetical protein
MGLGGLRPISSEFLTSAVILCPLTLLILPLISTSQRGFGSLQSTVSVLQDPYSE